MTTRSAFHSLRRLLSGATAGRGFLFLLFLIGGTVPAAAQKYLFRVPALQMYVTVQSDGSALIDYNIHFENLPGAHVIDVVDVGAPTEKYNLRNVKAWIGDRRLANIRPSEYVHPGFEVHLGVMEIQPGQSGTFRTQFVMPEMVFQDTTRDDYASFRITPTWFGEEYVIGTTDIQVAVELPKWYDPKEIKHQGLNFTNVAKRNDKTVVYWQFPRARLTGKHLVAVSFPKRDMQRVIEQSKWDLLMDWFRESKQARWTCGIIAVALFGWTFFRFTGGTGFSVFFILAAVLVVSFCLSPGWQLLALPLLVVLIGVNEWFLARRRTKYMPPIAQIEGGGIKRGLTAPEAAVLLELPIAKVLMLVIFGMLKKGILRQVQADPLVVEPDPDFKTTVNQEDREKHVREIAQKKGVVWHTYEMPFLYLLQQNPSMPVKEIHFAVPVRKLIEGAAARMAGFDLSETQDYYRRIVKRAVAQAAAVGDIPQREATLDRNFEWILMDDDYPTVFTYGRPYWPVWTRGGMFGGGGAPAPSAPSAPSIPGQTTFSDVAASFSGWTENTLGSFASSIAPEALSPGGTSAGFLDLSGADRVTGEVFKSLAEASTSGGGRGDGGGCACACAGCACACACAGGGR
ncbi:MAG: hypothetical protein JXB10_00050 [Pirellulales bacterium]|nr:hypothetical protein [Pirellulales bacterium]